MSAARAVAWVSALGAAALFYVVSVAATGEWAQNGPWLILVVVFVGFGADVVRFAVVANGADDGE
ncbi:hypothetical protein [Pseudomonas sp.]|uniref:hypothetical protein n=1 Tax=Pseudomonas sp. TaxID=306 RepID=UPI00263652BE|nr:hypothetical protein [Pseudomonas sp.]